MDDLSKLKSCSSCIHVAVCVFLKAVHEANTQSITPPGNTIFLQQYLTIAELCMMYQGNKLAGRKEIIDWISTHLVKARFANIPLSGAKLLRVDEWEAQLEKWGVKQS